MTYLYIDIAGGVGKSDQPPFPEDLAAAGLDELGDKWG